MILAYILFVVGFVLLIFSAKWLVEGSSSIAKNFKIPDLIIGLTVVAFGTSAPELIVNVIAGVSDKPDLAIGNIIGSNISNIMLILGVTAIIMEIPVQKSTILSEIPFSLTAALLFGFLANITIFEDEKTIGLSQIDGLILIFFFFLFLLYIIYMARQNQDIDTDEIGDLSTGKAVIFSIIGIVGLFVGGKFVVDNASEIARSWGFSETFIGLTIVGIGTSLPELVTSAIAALKRNADIAVGNIVGSNIFNLLWVLGITAMISPLKFDVVSNIDILVIIGSSALLILFMLIGRKYTIDRWQGIIFVLYNISRKKMGSTNDLRVGAVIKYNNDNYIVETCEFRKPGKGGAFFQVKLKNLITGNKAENKFRSGESIDFVRIEKHPYQYLYRDGDFFVFMNNESYEQVSLPNTMVGDQELYMKENEEVSISFEGEKALAVEIPLHVNLLVVETEPGLRGDTATNVSKPAKLETGASISVPIFVNEGDKIRIDTNTHSYIERIKD
jgi:cation:H+ antiporter